MYAVTLLVAALGMVAAAPSEISARQAATVASVDRYSGSGCLGTICVGQIATSIRVRSNKPQEHRWLW